MISDFSTRLEKLLKEKKLRKTDLSRILDVPKQTINGYFGDRIPKAEVLIRISQILDVSIDYLLLGKSTILSYSDDLNFIINHFDDLNITERKKIVNYIEIATSCQCKNDNSDILIPVLGKVAAGQPILAVENRTEFIKALNRYVSYALLIKGDSMEPVVLNGENVQIQLQNSLENGEIGILMIDNEATCKKFYQYEDHVELVSLNKKYKPIKVFKNSSTDFQILGKVVLTPEQEARF